MDGGTCRFDKSGIVYHAVCSGCRSYNSAGHSTSDFPTTPGAWSRTNNSGNCNNAAFKFDLSTLKARIQTNSVHFDHPGLNKVCLNDKIVFQNLSIGGQVYKWNLGDGTVLNKIDTSFINYQYKNTGKYIVKLKAIDAGTCTGADSTYTTINVYQATGAAGPDQTVCYGTLVILGASGGVDYKWISLDKAFSSSLANPVVTAKSNTDYSLTITDTNGCVVKDTVSVYVTPGIDLQFKAEADYGCIGRPSIKVTNFTNPAEDVFFDFGDGTTSDQQQVIHPYQKDGTYNIRLVGKKETCIYEKSVVLPFYYRLVPNVFTPDHSGSNDTFMVQYGEQKPVAGAAPLALISLKVYNRWGKLMYESDNYKNDWSGGSEDGGVYYYDVTIHGECTCKGWVDIIK